MFGARPIPFTVGCLAAVALLTALIRGAIVDPDAAAQVAVAASPAQPEVIQSREIGHPNSLDELCAEHAHAIDIRTKGELNVVTLPPFVVAGDLSRDQLQVWRDETILPFAQALTEQFFDRRPQQPITVMLFSSESPYREYARRLFGDVQISRFGYYKPDRRTLLANVEDGPAPLFHELVHALMAGDFPTAPAWLCEGIAVMCESAILNPDGSVQFLELPQWRMQALKQAADSAKLSPLSEVFAKQDLAAGDEAVAYAQAGGLCLMLHERGVLVVVYRRLRDADNSGDNSLPVIPPALQPTAEFNSDVEFRRWLLQGETVHAHR